MSLKESLMSLGLTEKEARVYIALVSLGESVVYVIAEKSGLKRPTVYVTLNELVKKGYAKRIPRARKQLYFPVAPDEVFTAARERFLGAEHALPELRALARGDRNKKVRTTYYQGEKQTRDAFFDTLNYPNTTLIGWMSEQPWRSTGGADFWEKEYRPKRLAQHIRNKLILLDTKAMHAYVQEGSDAEIEARIETKKIFSPTTDILLYGENRILITSFEEQMALIIESKHMHDTLLSLFRCHWDALARST